MRAIRFHEIGGPEVLKMEEVDSPLPGRGQVLVRIHAAGVNFADTLHRRGLYLVQTQLPATPGAEAAGVVEEVGEGLDRQLVGRRVAFLGQACYAEYARVSASSLIPLPDSISFEQGAAFPLQALTAYHMYYTMDDLSSRQSVLVHAAAGGVGLFAVQMAKQIGVMVLGTTSSEEKAELARSLGCDHVILYNKTDFADEALRLTNGRGVDLVLDSVGKVTFEGSLKCVAPFGHVIVYGAASGRPDPIDTIRLFEKSVKISGFWLAVVHHVPEAAAAAVRSVVESVASGSLKVVIGLTLPLSEAAEAHRRMEARETTGKIVLKVN